MGRLLDWLKEFDPGASFIERMPPHPERLGDPPFEDDLYEWEAEDLMNDEYATAPWGRIHTEAAFQQVSKCGEEAQGWPGTVSCILPVEHGGLHESQEGLTWRHDLASDPSRMPPTPLEQLQAPNVASLAMCPSQSGSGLPCSLPRGHAEIHKYYGGMTVTGKPFNPLDLLCEATYEPGDGSKQTCWYKRGHEGHHAFEAVDVTPEPVLVSRQLERIADALESIDSFNRGGIR